MSTNYNFDMKFYYNTENLGKPEFFIDSEGKCKLCKGDIKKEKCNGECPFCYKKFSSNHIPKCKCAGPKIKEECIKGECFCIHHCIKCKYDFYEGKYCCKCNKCEKEYIWGKKRCECDEGIIDNNYGTWDYGDNDNVGYYLKRCYGCDKVRPQHVVDYDDFESGGHDYYDHLEEYGDNAIELTPYWDRCLCGLSMEDKAKMIEEIGLERFNQIYEPENINNESESEN